MQQLIDRIYEAAFIPELWPSVIERIGQISGAKSGSLLIMDGASEPRWKATDLVEEALGSFIETGTWRTCAMAATAPRLLRQGFVLDAEVLEPDVLALDPAHRMQRALGLGSQLACVIEMPTTEFVVWTLEHELHAGAPGSETVERLNELIGHLSRAGLIAARLGLEKAKATVFALQSLGLPAAVLSGSGKVTAANPLLEGMPSLFVPTAYGGLGLDDTVANQLFAEAVQAVLHADGAPLQSIPVRAKAGRPPAVVHVLPVRRSARDVFSGADILVVATAVGSGPGGPSTSILAGLFDLTPAEARVAIDLTAGLTLAQVAQRSGITTKTARTYLERIFAKTGTHRQVELVAMLNAVSQFSRH
jgi:DNA-binding CsgD family transcriptional regulator